MLRIDTIVTDEETGRRWTHSHRIDRFQFIYAIDVRQIISEIFRQIKNKYVQIIIKEYGYASRQSSAQKINVAKKGNAKDGSAESGSNPTD